MAAAVDSMLQRLRDLVQVRAQYKDASAQARLLEKHFRDFDRDGSGVVDFDEFSRAMVALHFVGVQREVEALFDRFDEDLNGVLSYAEFARGVVGGEASAGSSSVVDSRKQSLLETVRTRILAAGGKNGLRTLRVLLRRMDQNGNGSIDLLELRDGLLALGVRELRDDELTRVFRYLDRDSSGGITIDELLRGLRGEMSKRRILLVKQAFARLDADSDGRVTLEEVAQRYDASQHPAVLAGRMTPRDALREFMGVFEDTSTRDACITWHEFLAYYRDLSAGFGNDDEFELMVRNAWHLSGGTGWSENSSNRRVLVTLADGTQRVVEIQDDLGIRGSDRKRMLQRLAEQGLVDVVDLALAN